MDSQQISLRLPDPMLNELERIGEPLGVKRSHLIAQAIMEFLDRHRKDTAHDQREKRHLHGDAGH